MFLHAAQYQPKKTGYPLWAKQTQLYYADKGVVFTADLVILATQSTKRLALFVDVLPHMELQRLRKVKRGSSSSRSDRPQQCVNTDMSRQHPCVISKEDKDRGRGFVAGLGVAYGFTLECDKDFLKFNWPNRLLILFSVALVAKVLLLSSSVQLMCNATTYGVSQFPESCIWFPDFKEVICWILGSNTFWALSLLFLLEQIGEGGDKSTDKNDHPLCFFISSFISQCRSMSSSLHLVKVLENHHYMCWFTNSST